MLNTIIETKNHLLSGMGLLPKASGPVRIGLALGGGFARGIAHAGVLKVLERHGVPLHCIAGISAGSIVAAAYASGATPGEIARAGTGMRLSDVARWTVNKMGFAGSDKMAKFLRKLLREFEFESMRIPLGVVATDLASGAPAIFRERGDVVLAVRASCSYPGLFQPVRHDGRLLVDGGISMDVPAKLCREMGATHVIAVHLDGHDARAVPGNMFEVVTRCFQIVSRNKRDHWREYSDVVVSPEVRQAGWDGFGKADELLEAGERAAMKILPAVEGWLGDAPAIGWHECEAAAC